MLLYANNQVVTRDKKICFLAMLMSLIIPYYGWCHNVLVHIMHGTLGMILRQSAGSYIGGHCMTHQCWGCSCGNQREFGEGGKKELMVSFTAAIMYRCGCLLRKTRAQTSESNRVHTTSLSLLFVLIREGRGCDASRLLAISWVLKFRFQYRLTSWYISQICPT